MDEWNKIEKPRSRPIIYGNFNHDSMTSKLGKNVTANSGGTMVIHIRKTNHIPTSHHVKSVYLTKGTKDLNMKCQKKDKTLRRQLR